jgi:hypothetical protein
LLLSSGFQQEEKIRRLGCVANPIFVHGNSVDSPTFLEGIQKGEYIHVLSSPVFTGRRLIMAIMAIMA